MRESEEIYRLIFSVEKDAIFLLDAETRQILDVNPAGEELYGWTKEELLNMRAEEFSAEPESTTKALSELTERGEIEIVERWHKKKDGTVFPIEIKGGAFTWGGRKVLGVIARDITQAKAAEEALKRAHSQLERRVEERTAELRKSNEQLKGEIAQRKIAETALQKAHHQLERRVEERTAELRTSNEQLKGEIAQRKIAETALRESEERYRLLAENSLTGLYTHQRGEFTYVNQRLAEMMGYSVDEVMGRKFWHFVHPKDREKIKTRGIAISEGHRLKPTDEFRVLCKNGSFKWFEVISHPVTHLGRIANMGNVIDITDRKIAENKIRESLKEKEILLREIHHRVKNNLSVIISLLDLQSRYAKVKPPDEAFREIQDRIHSMAVAHEMLYQSENLAALRINEYVENLVNHLAASLDSAGAAVRIEHNIDDVYFALDTAMPLGSILIELISNCFKHAFPSRDEGEIRISLHSTGSGGFELIVKDNGVGIPEEIDLDNPQSFGLDLVDAFVQELRGKIDVRQDRGTEFRVTFREKTGNPMLRVATTKPHS